MLGLVKLCVAVMLSSVLQCGVVVKDGKTYLDRMNYEILNDNVLEWKMSESKYSYVLLMNRSDDSRRFKNLFDEVSIKVMDELRQVKFYIINATANPKSLEFFGVLEMDLPVYRFYSYTDEIPYTDYFWNRYRMADYFRQRVLNQVVTLDSREDVERVLHFNDSFIYFHNDSVDDHNNKNLLSLQSMACLYHDMGVYLVKNEGLFEYAKTLAPLDSDPNLKNKAHMIVYHSSHTGINAIAFDQNDFGFANMRKYYREHRFALLLDYNMDVHRFLFIENISAIFLVVEEINYRHRKVSKNWGKSDLKEGQ